MTTTHLALRSSLAVLFTAAAAAAPQDPADLFTAGLELVDETVRFETLHDVNGDGVLDAIGWFFVDNQISEIRASVTLFDGEGGILSHITELSQYIGANVNRDDAHGSCIGDFDGNGILEQIVLVYDTIFHMEIAPTGLITFLPTIPVPNPYTSGASWSYRDFSVADFTGDGIDDFVISGSRGMELWSFHTGAATEHDTVSWGQTLRTTMDVGEFTGDGRADVAVSFVAYGSSPLGAYNAVLIYPIAAGRFEAPTELRTNDRGGPLDVSTGDIDGDGDDDLLLFGHTRELGSTAGGFDITLYRMIQTTPGTFEVSPRNVDSGPATALADVNGDGYLDGICCGGGTGGVQPFVNDTASEFMVCLGDAAGNFTLAVPFQGLGAEHIGGAADFDGDGDIDLIAGRVVLLNTQEAAAPECGASLNSRSLPAIIHAGGSASLQRNDLLITTRNLPPNQPAIVFYGVDRAATPLFDGTLCVGSQIRRLPVAFSDAAGWAALNIDFSSPLMSGLTAGDVIRIQTWYRDPGFGQHSNLSSSGRILLMP